MVSLQAGKHGGPSLQWSSRVMNHAIEHEIAVVIGKTEHRPVTARGQRKHGAQRKLPAPNPTVIANR